ncbi:MAG: DUF4153 domain-containing protein [Bacteroidales bacterium]|nr:DUF4153 domain-containing protein [Bacteroidales bacterium]
MKTFINPSNLFGLLKKATLRFPVAVPFIALLTVLMLLQVWIWANSYSTFKIDGSLFYYASCGIWISLMFHLWMEDCKNKSLVLTAFVASHVLLAIDAYHFYNMTPDYISDNGFEIFVSRLSIFTSCALLALALPFLNKKNDIEAVNFTLKTVVRALQSGLIALVGLIGWSILFGCTVTLFNIDKSGTIAELSLGWPLVIMCMTVPMLIFIGRIPEGEDKHVDTFKASKFYSGILHYLFIPLVLCYISVLYVYLFKIILTWSLPQGGVVTMVSSMIAGVTLVVAMLYPLATNGDNRFDKMAIKYLPILALPLVVLMAVGLIRRFSDYGISVNRIYVAVFCIYCFILCIGLIINKARRISFIPISFCILFLLTSAHPFNIINSTCNIMHNKLREKVAAFPPKHLPMESSTEINYWLYNMPDSCGNELASYIQELRSYRGHCFDTTIVQKGVWYSEYLFNDYVDENNANPGTKHHYDYYSFPEHRADTLISVFVETKKNKIPAGYKYFTDESFRVCAEKDSVLNDGILTLEVGDETLEVDMTPLLQLNRQEQETTKGDFVLNATSGNGQNIVVKAGNGRRIKLLEYDGLIMFCMDAYIYYNEGVDF